MLSTPHVLTALVIAKIIPHPVPALLLAFLSHFLLDFFIPHWNPHLYTEFNKSGRLSRCSLIIIVLDSLLALGMFLILAYQVWPDLNKIIIYLSVSFLAILPDLIEIPYYFLNSQNKLLARYVDFEHKNQAKATVFWGLLTQALIIAASLKQLFF